MLADRDRIGGLGLAFLLAAGMIEVGVLKLPRVLAAKFGRDLWLLPPLLLVTSLISLAVFCWLGRRFPRETVFEYAPRLVGKIGGHILSLTLVLFWILCAARMVREFSDSILMSLVLLTPREVVLIAMLLATAYLARMGLEPLCRAAIIIVLLTIPIGVFLTVLTLVEADFSRLWPVLTQGVGKVLKGGRTGAGASGAVVCLLCAFSLSHQSR